MCNSSKTKEMRLTFESGYTIVGLEQCFVLISHKSYNRRTGEPGEIKQGSNFKELQGKALEYAGT